MTMAMLQQIAQTKSSHQVYQQDTEITILTQDDMIDPQLRIAITIGTITMTIETGIGLVGPDPIHAAIDTGVTVTVTHKEVTSPITDSHTTVHPITEAQAYTITDETPHTTDPHHAEVFPETTVDPDHVHHTNTTTKHEQYCLPALFEQPGKPKIGTISRSPLSTIALISKPATQKIFKLEEPSPSTSSHKWGGLPKKDTITIAHKTDCPTTTVHAGKCYKALIDSGPAISLLRYSTYKKIEDCYKTPIQPNTAKLNTADSSPMSAIGTTALHLRIAECKFTHNFIICDQVPETELIGLRV